MSPTAFSARQDYDTAPLGSLIRFYDGTPEPPARHRCKRAAWSNTNRTGRLVRKNSGKRSLGPPFDLSVPHFKLHVGNFGGDLTRRTVSSLCRPISFLPSSASRGLVRRQSFGTKRGVPDRLHDRRTEGDAHVRHWVCNAGVVAQAS